MPKLGLHLSIAGGYHQALQRARALGCQALQIFLQNPRQWQWREPPAAAIARFQTLRAGSGVAVIAAHLSYLPNLAAADPELYQRSWDRLRRELTLARRLGLDYLICHPGHAGDAGAQARLAAGLRRLVTALPPPPLLLLENTAGQRRELGGSLLELAAIIRAGEVPVGLCLDTAHAFAAGYDLTQEAGRARLWREVAGSPAPLRVVHLNDSLGGCHSHRDRHWHLGAGAIGAAALGLFLQELPPTVAAVILETPKKQPEDDPRNLATARRLLAAGPAQAENSSIARPEAGSSRRRAGRSSSSRMRASATR